MSTRTLAWREIGYVRKVMVRNPQALFFTIGLPLLYLFIFATFFGSEHELLIGQGTLKVSTVFVASVITIGVVSACFQYLALSIVRDRESGRLKRLRSAPVPMWIFLEGYLVNSILTAVLLAVLVGGLGWAVYGVVLPAAHLLAAIVAVLIGAVTFSALAFAISVVITKLTTMQAAAPAITLTLFFLSGNFFNIDAAPAALRDIATIFPVRHLLEAMLTAFNSGVAGSGFALADLGVVALWGVAGLIAATLGFRWTPAGEH